jgi:hypothetical protein
MTDRLVDSGATPCGSGMPTVIGSRILLSAGNPGTIVENVVFIGSPFQDVSAVAVIARRASIHIETVLAMSVTSTSNPALCPRSPNPFPFAAGRGCGALCCFQSHDVFDGFKDAGE